MKEIDCPYFDLLGKFLWTWSWNRTIFYGSWP